MITKFRGTWLSNFWPAPVVLDGERYESVEAGYQAAKVLDREIRERIRALPTAAAAKRFGRRIGRSIPFRPAWDDTFKLQVMRHLLRQKFTLPDLRQRLISTHDAELVEMNSWHDRFWGRCSCSRCGGAGQNWLGRSLAEIRHECLKADATSRDAGREDMADAA